MSLVGDSGLRAPGPGDGVGFQTFERGPRLYPRRSGSRCPSKALPRSRRSTHLDRGLEDPNRLRLPMEPSRRPGTSRTADQRWSREPTRCRLTLCISKKRRLYVEVVGLFLHPEALTMGAAPLKPFRDRGSAGASRARWIVAALGSGHRDVPGLRRTERGDGCGSGVSRSLVQLRGAARPRESRRRAASPEATRIEAWVSFKVLETHAVSRTRDLDTPDPTAAPGVLRRPYTAPSSHRAEAIADDSSRTRRTLAFVSSSPKMCGSLPGR